MPDSTPAIRAVEVPRSLWTGRLEFDLLNGRGWRVGLIEVVIRIDIVTVWWANRTLAVMDRDLFGQWLVSPVRVYPVDDVVWSVQGPHLCITIDNSTSYAVPEETLAELLGVI
jgi:hypothetical protein